MPKTKRKNQASIDYWRKREEAAKAAYVKEEAEYQKEVDKIYKNMLSEIQNEINAFYGKYAAKEGITIAEAKKRVSTLDIDEYSRKAERYVKEKNFSKIANEEMALYNLTMKVNRLELLKANINLELVAGFDEVDKITAEALLKRSMDELKRQAGILGDSVGNQSKSASHIVNASFHNATFSEDIWMYQDALRNSLNTLLQRGMVQGKHPRVLARDIEKQFGSSRYEAERLMRTELSRVQTEAAKETFKANDYGQYIFLPHDDACTVCLGIRDEVYNVADMEIGVNAPPMHPNCRCSIAAYMDRAEFDKWLDNINKPNCYGDYLRDVLGPARLNNKKELEAIERDVKMKGGSIRYLDNSKMVTNVSKGSPATIEVDRNISIAGMKHEHRHFLDDLANGMPGIGYYISHPEKFEEFEMNGYREELEIARDLGYNEIYKTIVNEMNKRRAEINGKGSAGK